MHSTEIKTIVYFEIFKRIKNKKERKKILKEEKGITLVALVITIIVLLILAGVAISTLSGRDNIISKAQKARDDYNDAGVAEETELDNYVSIMEEHLNGNGGNGGKSDTIAGTYSPIIKSEPLILNDDGTWNYETVSGNYTYSSNVLSIILNENTTFQYNVKQSSNGTTILYTHGVAVDDCVYAKDPSKVVAEHFETQKNNIMDGTWTYTFNTDGSYSGTSGSSTRNGTYAFYPDVDWLVMYEEKNGKTSANGWYEFTSETAIESLN